MDTLTLENLLDMREAVARRVTEVRSYKGRTFEGKREAERRAKSLAQGLDQIEARIKDLQYEEKRLPY